MGNTKSGEVKPSDPIRRKSRSVAERSYASASEKTVRRIPHSARSSMSSQGNKRPVLSASQRLIIKYCIDNAKDDIGERILRRALERKEDFRTFIDNLPRPQRQDIQNELKTFILTVCDSLMDSEEIQKLSEEFGCSHVQFRAHGFKPDFFASTADAVTTECTFLDQATHTPSETAGAWSMLTSFVFSHVRDGYYAELRKQRKSSSAFRSRPSVDVSTDGSVGACENSSRRSRSASPATDDFSHSSEPRENTNFLLPPQVY